MACIRDIKKGQQMRLEYGDYGNYVVFKVEDIKEADGKIKVLARASFGLEELTFKATECVEVVE